MLRPFTTLSALIAAMVAAAPATASAADGSTPPALNGLWRTTFDGGDQYLRIDGGTYFAFVQPRDEARGRVDVHEDTVTFAGSNRCTGAGTYTWSVQASTLTLTPLGPDPCPRAAFLGLPWEHVSG